MKRELRAKAKAEQKHLFSITLDSREVGGGSITLEGVASDADAVKIKALINELLKGGSREQK